MLSSFSQVAFATPQFSCPIYFTQVSQASFLVCSLGNTAQQSTGKDGVAMVTSSFTCLASTSSWWSFISFKSVSSSSSFAARVSGTLSARATPISLDLSQSSSNSFLVDSSTCTVLASFSCMEGARGPSFHVAKDNPTPTGINSLIAIFSLSSTVGNSFSHISLDWFSEMRPSRSSSRFLPFGVCVIVFWPQTSVTEPFTDLCLFLNRLT
mmetsp:Transcript_11743/g.26793  ORF Transcript_11743/g.26793 Transcript_11743/m.26793 type:complete len:210 (+) Transcript_11743:261-890(+)